MFAKIFSMKKVIFGLIVIVSMASCSKKQTYLCQTWSSNASGGVVLPWVEYQFTERQMERWIKENSTDLDGNKSIITNGEQVAECKLK